MNATDYTKYESTDYLLESGNDLYDLAHEQADQDEAVIYYGKAMELVNNASSSEIDNAESELEGMSSNGKPFADCDSFGHVCQLLAYQILQSQFMEQYREELEEDKETLEGEKAEKEKELEALEEKKTSIESILEDSEDNEVIDTAEEELDEVQTSIDELEDEIDELDQAIDTIDENL